jgi:hypothetical protein
MSPAAGLTIALSRLVPVLPVSARTAAAQGMEGVTAIGKYIILGLVAAMGLFGGGLCLAETDLSARPGDSPAIADIKQRIAKVSAEVDAWNQRSAATVENASRTVVAPRDQATWRPVEPTGQRYHGVPVVEYRNAAPGERAWGQTRMQSQVIPGNPARNIPDVHINVKPIGTPGQYVNVPLGTPSLMTPSYTKVPEMWIRDDLTPLGREIALGHEMSHYNQFRPRYDPQTGNIKPGDSYVAPHMLNTNPDTLRLAGLTREQIELPAYLATIGSHVFRTADPDAKVTASGTTMREVRPVLIGATAKQAQAAFRQATGRDLPTADPTVIANWYKIRPQDFKGVVTSTNFPSSGGVSISRGPNLSAGGGGNTLAASPVAGSTPHASSGPLSRVPQYTMDALLPNDRTIANTMAGMAANSAMAQGIPDNLLRDAKGVGIADLRQKLGLGPAMNRALIVTDVGRLVPDMTRAMPPTTVVTVIPYKGTTPESIQEAARNLGANVALVARTPQRIEMPNLNPLGNRDSSGDKLDPQHLRLPVPGPIATPLMRRPSFDPALPPPWQKPPLVPAIPGPGKMPDIGGPALPTMQGLVSISTPPIKPDAVDRKMPSIPNVHWTAAPGDLKRTDISGISPSPNAGAGVGGWKSGTVAPAVPPIRTYVPPIRTYMPPVSTYVPPIRTYMPPVSTYVPPVSTYVPPIRTYMPPVSTYVPPVSTYMPPMRTYTPPPMRFDMPKFTPPPVMHFR